MVDQSPAASMSVSPSTISGEKKHWWLSSKKVVEKYVREARVLVSTRDPTQVNSALSLLDAALALSPRFELALELKARCLLRLRRFKEVADMLQDYIPSYRMAAAEEDDSSGSSDNSSQQLSRERVKLLHSGDGGNSESDSLGFKCFSVSELKRKVLACLCKNCNKEGQWRYLVLGQACCHLGLMEDAMVLLQTGKRLATAAFRRESICWSDDSFSSTHLPLSSIADDGATPPTTVHHHPPPSTTVGLESTTKLLSQIKLLLRRRAAALAALDAGLYTESIHHFSKILDGRRAAPQAFLAECYLHRSTAYRAVGRVADSIADCNRTLALDPSFIRALEARAELFESIGSIADALHDLEHVKLLLNSILRDRKLPGPAWKPQTVWYREVPGMLCALTAKIQELKQRIVNGDQGNVDHYKLIGLKRGCLRSELERAHLLLIIRHKPDKAIGFLDRCELVNESDYHSVRDRARFSALLLYRLIQKGHTALMAAVREEEGRRKTIHETTTTGILGCREQQLCPEEPKLRPEQVIVSSVSKFSGSGPVSHHGSAFQGVFCRDLAVVGSLLSQVGFNRSLSMKYEALSC
ncbi:hypothetical protein Dimus_032431 [Dionaea muscipula]